MEVTIRNMADQRTLVRLNSGISRYLAPGELLSGVATVDIRNRWIEKLEKQRIIVIEPGDTSGRRRSGDMRADEAIEHIGRTPLSELEGFLSPGESRVSVLKAMKEKQQ